MYSVSNTVKELLFNFDSHRLVLAVAYWEYYALLIKIDDPKFEIFKISV